MNFPPGPYLSTSTTASSDDVEAPTFPAYSYPSQITATSPFQSPANPGLGISYCETGPSTSYVRQHPSTERYHGDWTAQLLPTTMPFDYSLDTTQMTPATLCERYSGSDASASPLSYCGPQAMSATSSHGSALDFAIGLDNMNAQMYNFLPNTPRSDPDVMIKEEPDADYPDAQCLDYTKPAHLPLFAPVAQHRTNRFWPKFTFAEEDDASEPALVDHDLESNLSPGSSAFQLGELPQWPRDNTSADHEQLKVPSASGRQCTICGAQFTRRSNCREHEKRHDPSNRKSFTCGVCGKALGRKTDLKRHVDSVHRGIRKYGCDECGTRFTRQDTLARHISDGCRRTGRRSSDSRAAERHSPVDNQTTIKSVD